ncbi:MAG: hypothetical protein J6Y55_04040 [Bacteroidales bacterium]|nr:hypothetical protein [Bacteroidales bacterium]
MDEKATIPYPERTEDIILLVCEPAIEYGKPIVYQGTTITNALKDYYSFTTNHEKVDVLKWIVAQPAFTELKRLSMAENKIFTLYTNQYDEILKTGEMPNNLQIAQKFVANKFDVYLLANPRTTKSADFIIKQRNILYYVEGKTSKGGSALAERLQEGAKQADRIAINFIGNAINKLFSTEIKNTFENNENLKYVYVFKGSKLIFVKRNEALSKTFSHKFMKLWTAKK